MRSLLGFAVTCLVLICGCSTLDLAKCKSIWPAGQEKPQQPASVVALWTEGVVHQSAGPPMRGYAGRVIFYGGDGTKPVKVDGTLTVYGFDETGRGKADMKPDRKYVFTPEQLANHYDPVKVGPAYVVWVPWDQAGGPRKDMSLIVRFAPRKGELVVGEMARLVLSGAPPPDAGPTPAQTAGSPRVADPMVRPTSYDTPTSGQPGEVPSREPAAVGIRSTTIPLPDNLTRQIAGAGHSNPALAERRGRTTIVPGGVATSRMNATGTTEPAAAYGNAPGAPLTASPAAGVPAATIASAASPPSRPTALPGVHSSLARPRVPGVPIAPLTRDHAASRPHPGASPYLPPSTPPPEPPPTAASTWPDGSSTRN
jgi:hypothetical protein